MNQTGPNQVYTGAELLSQAARISHIIEQLPEETEIFIKREQTGQWRIECHSGGRQILKKSTEAPGEQLEYLRNLFGALKNIGEEKQKNVR